ncbi:LpqB family beta-propeller domain-containing protein [Nocardiopsis sp. N85]|uniref:LpqB family beta-propeller domain-containing protein n=1 Tax=Nocardiopsis sp. N85 TaxID=3029400 RepID=UPI00237F97E2|nr:LpqB family beta-propeller domain-containing protein [Nocardiopsis sp. N85]MDE3721013.1 LpqB family beta-propeller domain-containing protein [Nocardiopsis sp. N85]
MSAPLDDLRRSVGALGAAVLACLLLASCATVPTTGPVVQGEGGASTADPYGGYVRLLPAGPQDGMNPDGLVGSFLKDMGSFEEDHEAARSYMLSETREEWDPDGSVKVFTDLDTVDLEADIAEDGLTAVVRMRSPLVATIDGDGKYRSGTPGVMMNEQFTLAREGEDPEGEWRIRGLPDELILSQLDVERTHRPFNLYYFNPEGTALVPDPIYLPVSTDRIAERLMRRLMQGPTSWSEPAVRSEFPEGTRPTVRSDAESVTVEVTRMGDADEFRMGAQIAWTLRQLPDIQEFTLVVDGDGVAFAGADGDSVDRPRPASGFWLGVNPGAVLQSVNAYYAHEGQLWSASEWATETFGEAERVPGPLGAGDVPLDRFAVSVDESTIAGVTLGGDTVVTSLAAPGADVVEVLDEGIFTELSWDIDGNLWVVEEFGEDAEEGEGDAEGAETVDPETPVEPPPPAPGSSAVWVLRDGDEVVRVDVADLRDESLVHFRISRDGARAAVVTEVDGRRSLKVGRVEIGADGQVSVGDFVVLAGELADVSEISWRSADQLAVLGRREGGTDQVFLVALDGGSPPSSAGNSVTGLVTVSGAPGQPLVAGTDDGNIWISNDRLNWKNAGEGGSPAFPG